MAKGTPAYLQFNRGVVSPLALARTDLKRTAISAELQTNWVPRVLGPMSLRPGLGYLGSTLDDVKAKFIPFIFATDDTALVEMTGGFMRIWIDDEVLTRPAVTTTITNGNFTIDLSGWTDLDEAGTASTWVAPGYMQLLGDGTSRAIREQQVTVAGANIGVLHALDIVIQRGPVTIRVGSASGGDQYVSETQLATGQHSLAFTPTGDFYVRFSSDLDRVVWVDSVGLDAAGPLELPHLIPTENLFNIRWDQSGDVLFLACVDEVFLRIERRPNTSWSIVGYYANDGPFRAENTTGATITPSATVGNITLTGSQPIFKATNVGSLYRIETAGQLKTRNISAQNTFTDPIRVQGADAARSYSVILTGVWVATVSLQRSLTANGPWEDTGVTYTSNGTSVEDDQMEDQILFYRVGVKTGDYTSGTVNVQMVYNNGFQVGVVRVTDFTSETVVGAEVYKELGSLGATKTWSEGVWSNRRGYPSAVSFYEGRLWWAGKNRTDGSVSDAFDNYDPDTEGDSGPINRTIGSGPVDRINWLLPLQRLMIGAQGAEYSARSTSFDEPLTPSNFNVKSGSTQGSASVLPSKIDQRGVFVDKSGARVYELAFDPGSNDYSSNELTVLVPEIGGDGIVTTAVQRKPDTRLHCVRDDGLVALGVIDKVESVLSWQLIETEGVIEDVVMLPQAVEDAVYYEVRRDLVGVVNSITLLANSNFVTLPVITFTGDGTGAEATCRLALTSFGYSPGSGYTVGDVLTLAGGSYTTAATASVATVDGSGGILVIGIIDGGVYTEGIIGSATAVWAGGTGSGFTSTSNFFSIRAGSLVMTRGGLGYSYPPTIDVTGEVIATQAVMSCTIANQTRRYLEKWALTSECEGGTLNKQADSFVTFTSASPTGSITGLDHLEGNDVVVWADGNDLSPGVGDEQTTYGVVGGVVTLADGDLVSNAVVGLPYSAPWKSTKLANVADENTTALGQRKKVTQLGLLLYKTHSHGLQYGGDFDNMDDLPEVNQEDAIVGYNDQYDTLDLDMQPFNGSWSTDSRVCLRAHAPRNCTVLAMPIAIEENSKS